MSSTNDLCLARETVSALLSQVCSANSTWAVHHHSSDILSHFECSEVPSISVDAFMSLVEQAGGRQYWPMCLILTDQLCRAAGTPVSMLNVHRLLLTAYSISLKLSVDCAGQSARVARWVGVDVKDLVEMEMAFLPADSRLARHRQPRCCSEAVQEARIARGGGPPRRRYRPPRRALQHHSGCRCAR
eukprot:TRINITY_DN4273_c0_g1_i1.p1 TRINITY_DN4273_c0_g1~~TRINITY_DN4273_c0_g1_i1.p1  ORF type:complete len:187 (+),score=6.80 TRINITY_DN4273_c0_g1_i1:90-650(+)